MKRYLQLIITSIFLLSGCAGMGAATKDSPREFTYDFAVTGKTQSEIWKSVRDFFAEKYGDSRSVFRVLDEQDGTMIGRGTSSWTLLAHECLTDYHIRFAAKDNKARLQFEIIEGVPARSHCIEWAWPTKNGYDEIVEGFSDVAKALDTSLAGQSSADKLKDF